MKISRTLLGLALLAFCSDQSHAQNYGTPTFSALTVNSDSLTRNNGTLNTVPSGTYRAATSASAVANSTVLKPQVNGFTAPNQLYVFGDVGNVALYTENSGNIVDDNHPNPTVSSWTSTTANLSTPLTSTQIANINAMIAQNNVYGNPVGPMARSSDGLLGNITAVSANTVTVGNWMAQGNAASGQVPVGTTLQLNPQIHIWAQNSVVRLPANTIANTATAYEADFLNQKGPSGGTANIVGMSMNCHDTGFTYGCQTGFTATGTALNPWTYGYNSFQNKIGFISQGDSLYGFQVDHKATDPTFGFVSFQTTGHPFGFSPGGGGSFAWSVGNNGGMNVGDATKANGFVLPISASGTNPQFAAACVDANCDLELRGNGTGAVSAIGGMKVGSGLTISSGITTMPAGAANAPSLVGSTTTTTGIYWDTTPALNISAGGARVAKFSANTAAFDAGVISTTSGNYYLRNIAPTATVPDILPNNSSNTAGIGAYAAGGVSLIANSLELIRLDTSGVTTLNSTAIVVPSAVGGTATKYVCSDASNHWFSQVSPC